MTKDGYYLKSTSEIVIRTLKEIKTMTIIIITRAKLTIAYQLTTNNNHVTKYLYLVVFIHVPVGQLLTLRDQINLNIV